MPKIRHWFNVSHDINSDEEVWELTDTYGVWGLRVWLQMLSIADRNEGVVKGDLELNAKSMSRLWGSNSRRYSTGWRVDKARMMIQWMADKKWIVIESDLIRVRNYWNYRPTRESKKDSLVPPPHSPHTPHITKPIRKEEEKKQMALIAPFILPGWIPTEAWDGFLEMRKKLRKPLTERAKSLAVKELDKLRVSGNDPGCVLDQSTAKSWLGLFEVKTMPEDDESYETPMEKLRKRREAAAKGGNQ